MYNSVDPNLQFVQKYLWLMEQVNSVLLKRSKELADKFLEFVNKSKSPFHAVQWCRQELTNNGFKQLSQTSNWELKKGNKYFFTRNNSTLIAFDVGTNYSGSKTGFKIIGTHTDSPCLRLAPVSKAHFKSFSQSYICTYGGGLWHTWFDRDLVLAGKVIYQGQKGYTSKLWESSKPILKIPNLAIHLVKERKFQPNTENQLRPILSSDVHEKLINQQIKKEASIFSKHDAGLISMISKDLSIDPEKIVGLDLCFADSQLSSYTGINDDFISSPRLDNLFSSFHAIMALIQSQNKGQFINVAALFDHQECGSVSAQGAASSIVMRSLQRIYKLLGQSKSLDDYQKSLQKSFFISADMAHSIHPNYSDKHQANHQVQINKGVVFKINYNQRYASDLVSCSILRALAEKADVPVQDFIVKNDSPCGSTIGPDLAALSGIKTIDVGCAMLGMHSIRETCGIIDGAYYRDLFSSFYKNYQSIAHDLLDH